MMLIGQYDSPFARRVGITLALYGFAFEHNKWSVFGNAEELGRVNPLIRVPTLVLDSGEALIETAAIIDYLDSLVPAAARLLPQDNPARYRCAKVVSLASGISDMAVRLFYEQRLHETPSEAYVARLTRQLTQTVQALEAERAAIPGHTWMGGAMTQADIAVTCTLRHLTESQPELCERLSMPALAQHCAHYEAQEVFQRISQPFIAPAG